MFLAMGEALTGVFSSPERPSDSTVGVICCVVEAEDRCCLTVATGVEGSDPAAVATGAGVMVAAAAALAILAFFFWFFERGVEGTSAGVLIPADEGEGLATDPAGETAGEAAAAIFCPFAMTAALGVAGISISTIEKKDKVGDGGNSEIFVVSIVVLMNAGVSC